MAITKIDYFYDKQQYRFLEQIVRAFSGFQYMTGRRGDIEPELRTVPCRSAVTNTVVANILRNQSESALLTVPMITCFQTGLTFRRADLQSPTHESTVQATERYFDTITGQYSSSRGKSYTVKRLMPLPFEMNIQVDIWTSNLDQKNQLVEQILMAICPDFQIQSSENGVDWTAIAVCEFVDFTLSSRQIPVGSSDEIDIATITLKIPMWISPPALVTEQTLIERVITNMSDTAPLPGVYSDDSPITMSAMGSVVETIGNHSILVSGNQIMLLGPKGSQFQADGETPYSWEDLILSYGVLRPSSSQIMLMSSIDDRNGIVGTIEYDTNNPNILHWSIDPMTLIPNTLPAVDGVINPLETYPDQKLPPEVNGQRYILLCDMSSSLAWGNITAKESDIIQYVSNHWEVVFAAADESESTEYVLNTRSNKQLKWTGKEWIYAVDNHYPNSLWRLII